MLLRQMKYLVSVVDCNSFTEAAEQNFISQSAISQQIQALEKELDVELIHREKRKFSLTPAGEYFYKQSKSILEEVEELQRETMRIGQDEELQLRIGYLNCYNGQELHQAIADFSQLYPDVNISIVNGTHEELYNMIRTGAVDLVLNDQRRAFSDEYENFHLSECDCYIEISGHNKISSKECVSLEDLKRMSCILIAPKEQEKNEQEFYQNTLGFGGKYLFAENLEAARLMVVGNRGFMPVEKVGTLPVPLPMIRRLALCRGENHIKRTYCAFWKKDKTNYYIEEFAATLKKLL
ncbi:MAG: LysR family transcriptional regulator [Clostridia bacterium]|nr:LysR family transcriptional regulator [Lachnospiraceae bacterium]NCC01751.1 LysR family transcriptional regulator [Clostridia bacterium]NCD03672.1 LysR family transcriptional regulator [Clostridia bacterium]